MKYLLLIFLLASCERKSTWTADHVDTTDTYLLYEDTAAWVAGPKGDSLDHGEYHGDVSLGLHYQFNQTTFEIDSIWYKGEMIYPVKCN